MNLIKDGNYEGEKDCVCTKERINIWLQHHILIYVLAKLHLRYHFQEIESKKWSDKGDDNNNRSSTGCNSKLKRSNECE